MNSNCKFCGEYAYWKEPLEISGTGFYRLTKDTGVKNEGGWKCGVEAQEWNRKRRLHTWEQWSKKHLVSWLMLKNIHTFIKQCTISHTIFVKQIHLKALTIKANYHQNPATVSHIKKMYWTAAILAAAMFVGDRTMAATSLAGAAAVEVLVRKYSLHQVTSYSAAATGKLSFLTCVRDQRPSRRRQV